MSKCGQTRLHEGMCLMAMSRAWQMLEGAGVAPPVSRDLKRIARIAGHFGSFAAAARSIVRCRICSLALPQAHIGMGSYAASC